jgi:Mrp family chromosome partitioning ATPase
MSRDGVRSGSEPEERPADGSGADRESRAGTAEADAARPTPNRPVAASDALLPPIVPMPEGGRGWLFSDPSSPCPFPAGMATSVQVEALRELRTRLLAKAAEAGLTYFTTLVVPLTDDAGGSFVARNLAATFTLQNAGSLLIDCNFRNPCQDEALRAHPESEGLFDFLARTNEEKGEIPVRPTVIPGLYLIPAGRCETTFAAQVDLLSSTSMKALLSKLRSTSCYVVLDAPPALRSPDARILSDLVDFVVIIVRSGRSTMLEIRKAAESFDRKKLAGIAFNEYAGRSRSGHAS